MTVRVKSSKRYSLSFKLQLVREVEAGESISVVMRRYGIKGGSTLQGWIRKFGKTHLLNQVIRIETMEEKDRIRELEKEIKKLKLALADSVLAQRSLEVLIEEANKVYGTDLKKSYGGRARGDSGKSSV